MNKAEVVDLLQFAAGYDHLDITDERVQAWHRVLRLVELEDAKEAVAHHYQRSTRHIMAANVMDYVVPPASRHPSSAPVPVTLAVPEALAGYGKRRVMEAVTQARSANEARRARVLRHPDLARRLTEPPLGYQQPEQWNGFVPPAEIQDEAPEGLHSSALDGGFPNQHGKRTGATRVNTSSRRAALVDICAEAWRRERDEKAGGSHDVA